MLACNLTSQCSKKTKTIIIVNIIVFNCIYSTPGLDLVLFLHLPIHSIIFCCKNPQLKTCIIILPGCFIFVPLWGQNVIKWGLALLQVLIRWHFVLIRTCSVHKYMEREVRNPDFLLRTPERPLDIESGTGSHLHPVSTKMYSKTNTK